MSADQSIILEDFGAGGVPLKCNLYSNPNWRARATAWVRLFTPNLP
jgi:hypothetical protein